jgi:hypothetical protein
MRHRDGVLTFALLVPLLLFGTVWPRADASEERAPEQTSRIRGQGHLAIYRGLAFLQNDAAKWRKERKCASCHHGTMTVWALSEAKSRGYVVSPETVADVAKWTKERLVSIDKPRDSRPGWNMVSTPAVYLALMSRALPSQEAITPRELERIAGHLLRHQEADGSWAWSLAPRKNTPPPVFESDEVVTLMADVVLRPHVTADPNKDSPARSGVARASAWLERHKPGPSTQAAALQLFRAVQTGKSPQELAPGIHRLIALQRADGGWGQDRDLQSDAYATGQALYFLSLAGEPAGRTEIRRGVEFLVANQRADGSWPMKSRAHPGEKPMTNPVPITYFGTAWATLGMLRSVAQ